MHDKNCFCGPHVTRPWCSLNSQPENSNFEGTLAYSVHETIISCALIVQAAAKTWRIVGNWLNSYHALGSFLQIGFKLGFFDWSTDWLTECAIIFWHYVLLLVRSKSDHFFHIAYELNQGQLQEWTEHSHTDLWKSETSRDIKKSFLHRLNIFKSCIDFQN